MRFLCASDLVEDRNTGAAGVILDIGDALQRQGHDVDYIWHDPKARWLPQHTLSQLFELPRRQLRAVRQRLVERKYSVVIISQPYAYLTYEHLATRYPETAFLNQTHGWEERLYAAYHKYEWDGPQTVGRRVASHAVRAALGRACRRTVASCDGLIAPSSLCGEFIRTRFAAFADKVAVIPYGIEVSTLGERPPRPRNAPPTVLYVGNYLGRKGVGILRTVLADAARLHPDVRVTFVVDEAGATLVERDYRDTFGTHLEIRSWVDREALGQIYRAHDILIMPSLFEGFGKVWMEAMAEGTCVVGFAEGGLQDVARHEEHALLCDTGDTEALTALLDRALNDLDTTRQLGRRAQAQVRLFTWDRHANATERFVERALAKKAAAAS